MPGRVGGHSNVGTGSLQPEPTNLPKIVRRDAFLWGETVRKEYHAVAANDMDAQWTTMIAPILAEFEIDLTSAIDFAAGFGRNTRKLLEAGARHVTMVDVNPECIKELSANFSDEKTTAVLNNGYGLSELESSSYSFLYSFDAMVHFDPELIVSYMPEFFRVLKGGAYAFIHHSNYSGNPGGRFQSNPHWRNYMTMELFKQIATDSGFAVCRQAVLDWGVKDLDCRTVLRKP